MSKEKIIKISILNTIIALINIIIFSPGIVGAKIGGVSTFKTALAITDILMSIVVFVVGNYRLLMEKEDKIKSNEIETSDDCIEGLKQNKNKKTFTKSIGILFEQIERLEKKKETIDEILLEKFTSTEMSYSKFKTVINEIDKLFYMNIKSVINKLNIFDENDYRSALKESKNAKLANNLITEKIIIYNKYIMFVKEAIEDNEEILLKLDKLLLELSRFNSLEDGELEDMNAIREIDDLISKTKFYK